MKRHLISFLTLACLASAFCLAPAFSVSANAQGAPPEQGGPPQYGPPQYGAEPGPGPEDQGQQPQGGVGRISILNGNLSTQRGDSGAWVADTINTPVMPGDTLSTGPNSRAEVELDYANILRLADNTVANVADLEQGRIQVQVSQGLIDYVVIRDGDMGNTEVDTPNVAVHPMGRGVFRIQVNSPTEAVVTVREGQAQIATPQGSTNVGQGQTITVEGSDNPQYRIDEAIARDGWDRWNADRDKEILSAESWQHTDPYYTGSNDLDQYGNWQNAPGYGDVWVPSEPSDWSPYYDGSWAWEPDYGWTWVSGEPWGWAPYHYGRWFWWNNAWAWWPGPIGIGWGLGGWYRPIWAPAYVNFFGWGWGGGFGFGIGFGGFGFGWGRVGWLPVGPGDRFFPGWGRGRGFNVTNVTNITNVNSINNMRGGVAPLIGGRSIPGSSNLQAAFNGNSHVLGGLNTLAGNKFGEGGARPTRGAINAGTLRNASFVSGRLGVVPTKASLSPSGRVPAANSIHSVASHFAGSSAPAANRGAFAQQQASARQMVQSLSSRDVAEQGRANAERLNRTPASSATARQEGEGAARSTGVEPGRSGTFGSSANRSLGSAQSSVPSGVGRPATQGAQQSWRQFADRGATSGSANRSSAGGSPSTRSFGQTQTERPGATFDSPRTAPSPSGQQGWQRFSSQPAPRSSFANPARPESSFGPRATTPSYRGGTSGYGYSRPPLQMNRPMFSPRSAPGYGSYPRSNGGYSAPRSYRGGGYSAPRGYSAPKSSGGNSGGHSGGGEGGHSSGGSGGHSGGGGGHGGGRH